MNIKILRNLIISWFIFLIVYIGFMISFFNFGDSLSSSVELLLGGGAFILLSGYILGILMSIKTAHLNNYALIGLFTSSIFVPIIMPGFLILSYLKLKKFEKENEIYECEKCGKEFESEEEAEKHEKRCKGKKSKSSI